MADHGESRQNKKQRDKRLQRLARDNINSPPFGMRPKSQPAPTELADAQFYDPVMRLLNEEHQLTICKHIYDPEAWLGAWRKLFDDNPNFKQALRCIVMMGTVDAMLRSRYFLPDGRVINLDAKRMLKAAQGTTMYQSEHEFDIKKGPAQETRILVVEGDILQTALWLKRTTGVKPLVLGMASQNNPGGGYRSGAGAQEENLFRRTNLMQCVEDPYHTNITRDWHYPLPEFGGLYIPNAAIFRGPEAAGYPFMATIPFLSFVFIYAYKDPPTSAAADGGARLPKKIAQAYARKITTLFNIALENGHDSLILSALGCGAYNNPPEHISLIFKEVLAQPAFRGRFRAVVFAILDVVGGTNTNLNAFGQTFQVEPVTIERLLQEEEASKPPPEVVEVAAAAEPEVVRLPPLPLEVLRRLFSFLNFSDLVAAGMVCKDWREAALTPELWSTVTARLPRGIVDGAVFRLARAHPQLTAVDISGCAELSDNALHHLGRLCKGIVSINIADCPKIRKRELLGTYWGIDPPV